MNNSKNIVIFKLKGKCTDRDVAFVAHQIGALRFLEQGTCKSMISNLNAVLLNMTTAFTKGLSYLGGNSVPEGVTKTYSTEEVQKMKENFMYKQNAERELNIQGDELVLTSPNTGQRQQVFRFPKVQTYEIKDEAVFLQLRQEVHDKLAPFWHTEEYDYKRTDSVIYLPVTHFSAVQFQIDELVQKFGETQ